jgi:FAD/FMN-containing dehydrogenase
MWNPLKYSLIAVSLALVQNPVFCSKSIHDVSRLTSGKVKKIYCPKTINELQAIVRAATVPISIAGGRFSQGGHIWCDGGIVIDMKQLNTIRAIDLKQKKVTVEAGATWHQIQRAIDPLNLSIKVMQSYNDFSVGGSLSVNIHSRAIQDGTLIETVDSIKLLLADGTIITASRSENYELFKAAIGGYGALGIIVEATLCLTDNERIERQTVIMSIDQYEEYFKTMIKDNPQVVFHNADITISTFDTVTSVTWYKSGQSCTIKDRLQDTQLFTFDYFGFQAARYFQALQKIRVPMQILTNSKKVVWRNYEMSNSVSTVEPMSRTISTTVLQEYFVPCKNLKQFISHLHALVKTYNINMLNISIRYIHRDSESVMAYAQPEESFALVCYINMANNKIGYNKAQKWTQKLIDRAINCGGTYYLPYQLYATEQQFDRVYPNHKQLLEIKKRFDPNFRFMNSFLAKYMCTK